MIFRQTFAKIQAFSLETIDPKRSYLAMQKLLTSNVKLTKLVATSNLLRKMHKLGIGTNEVEIFSKVCSSQNKRKTIDRSLVKYAMKKKVEDAEWAVRQARIKFLKNKTEYNNVIRRNTFIDIEFQSMMKNECNTVRLERKAKNSQNVQFFYFDCN